MAIRLKENSKDISSKSCLLGGPRRKILALFSRYYWPGFYSGLYRSLFVNIGQTSWGGKRICLQWGFYLLSLHHTCNLTPVITLANFWFVLKSWYTGEAPEQGFWHFFTDRLNQIIFSLRHRLGWIESHSTDLETTTAKNDYFKILHTEALSFFNCNQPLML